MSPKTLPCSLATPAIRSRERIAGLANEEGNVLGLMPHPEHAVDPLLGPTGGVPLLEGLVAAARSRVALIRA